MTTAYGSVNQDNMTNWDRVDDIDMKVGRIHTLLQRQIEDLKLPVANNGPLVTLLKKNDEKVGLLERRVNDLTDDLNQLKLQKAQGSADKMENQLELWRQVE